MSNRHLVEKDKQREIDRQNQPIPDIDPQQIMGATLVTFNALCMKMEQYCKQINDASLEVKGGLSQTKDDITVKMNDIAANAGEKIKSTTSHLDNLIPQLDEKLVNVAKTISPVGEYLVNFNQNCENYSNRLEKNLALFDNSIKKMREIPIALNNAKKDITEAKDNIKTAKNLTRIWGFVVGSSLIITLGIGVIYNYQLNKIREANIRLENENAALRQNYNNAIVENNDLKNEKEQLDKSNSYFKGLSSYMVGGDREKLEVFMERYDRNR